MTIIQRIRILSLLAALTCAPSALHAATFTVINNLDAGAGSLREAIDLANASIGVDDLIIFDLPAGSTTITLTTAGLTITDTVTIDGANISGAGAITVTSALANTNVFFISGANASGTIIQNFDTISNTGDLGSAINVFNSTVTITDNTTISASGNFGSAINALDSTTIITDNATISASDLGTAIALANSTATITGNNTISAGTSGIAIFLFTSTATITGNTTIEANGDFAIAINAQESTATITDNATISATGNNSNAINVFDSSTATITDNTTISATGNNSTAINVFDSSTATITDNAGIAGTQAGVVVETNSVARILNNSIDNPLGIDLRNTFPGTVGNNNQAAPVIDSICSTDNILRISGSLAPDATATPPTTVLPNTEYIIQLFANPDNAPDQGLIFIGQFTVTTNDAGIADFSGANAVTVSLANPLDPANNFITATATPAAVSDTNGTSEFSVPVQAGTEPAIAVAVTPSTITAGQSATLSANITTPTTAPYTIRFATGNTVNADGSNVFDTQVSNGTSASVTVNPTSTTQFSADVTDANGCTSDSAAPVTLTVTTTPPPVNVLFASLNASAASVCAGQTVTLTALATNGVAPFTFSFSDGFTVTTNDRAVTRTVTPVVSTSYFVTITDSTGAQASANAAIAVLIQQRSLLSKALLAKYCS